MNIPRAALLSVLAAVSLALVSAAQSVFNAVETKMFVAGDAQVGDQLGKAVAIDGNFALVGAPGCDNGAAQDVGAAYMFIRTANGWAPIKKLIASDGAAGD